MTKTVLAKFAVFLCYVVASLVAPTIFLVELPSLSGSVLMIAFVVAIVWGSLHDPAMLFFATFAATYMIMSIFALIGLIYRCHRYNFVRAVLRHW